MGKTIIDLIEESFSGSTKLRFMPTADYNKGPGSVILVFPTPGGGKGGYEIMLEMYKLYKCTLIFHRSTDKLDMSIVIKDSANSINIKGLNNQFMNNQVLNY